MIDFTIQDNTTINRRRAGTMRSFRLLFIIFAAALSFNLNAQNKVELSTISFSGNNAFPGSLLKDLISSKETPAWTWKFLNSFTSLGKAPEYFDSTTIEKDIRSLSEFYVANGFFSVQISSSYDIDTTDEKAFLTYHIKENLPAKISRVKLYGLTVNDPELNGEISKIIEFDTSKRFSQSLIKSAIDNIVNALENKGYMLAKYDSTIVVQDTVENSSAINIFFASGKKYLISKLKIEKTGPGAESVENELLENIIGIIDGETYNLEKIRLSQVRLFRTGLFSSVILTPVTSDTLDVTVPLLLNGNIGLMNEISPEIIMNNQHNTFNIGLGSVIAKKNFLGNARKISLIGSFGISDLVHYKFSNILKTFNISDTTAFGFFEGTVKFEQPYVFNRPIFATLEGYIKFNKDNVSNKRNIGGKLSFEFELPRYTFINFLTAYYNFEIADEIFPHKELNVKISESLSVLGAEFKTFKANDAIFPTKGYNLTFLLEEANLINLGVSKIIGRDFSGTLFYKVLFSNSFYMPVSSRENTSVFATKVKLGYIHNYMGAEINIPSTRKFTVGGSNSLRAWKARDLAPREIKYSQGNMVDIVGGTTLIETGIEYRYKFTPVFGTVLFTDIGNTWLGYKNIKPDEFAVSSGLGLRYYSAFAPFRLDLAVRSYDPNDRRNFFKKVFFKNLFEFQIGIGEAF